MSSHPPIFTWYSYLGHLLNQFSRGNVYLIRNLRLSRPRILNAAPAPHGAHQPWRLLHLQLGIPHQRATGRLWCVPRSTVVGFQEFFSPNSCKGCNFHLELFLSFRGFNSARDKIEFTMGLGLTLACFHLLFCIQNLACFLQK